MHVKKSDPDSQFLNVDLDVYSRSDLQPLVESFGKKVITLYVGREKRGHSAHLELARYGLSADSSIRAFSMLIRALPKTGLEMWNSAKRREFSVGIQAGRQPFASDFRIKAETVKAVAAVRAMIVLTIYGSELAKQSKLSKGVKPKSSIS